MIVFFQVNGYDVTSASHEEALEAFKSAKEPIILEVLRGAAKPLVKHTNKSCTQYHPCANSHLGPRHQTCDYSSLNRYVAKLHAKHRIALKLHSHIIHYIRYKLHSKHFSFHAYVCF